MNPHEEHHEHEAYAFEADKVIFQVRDLADADELKPFRERLVNALEVFLRPAVNSTSQERSKKGQPDLNWRGMVKPPTLDDLRVIDFPALMQVQGSQRFSLIPLRIEGRTEGDREPDDVLRLLSQAYTELGALFSKPGGGGGGEPGKDKFQPIPIGVNKDIGLISISPNWLSGSMPHGKPTGGPGSLPASTPAPTGMQQQFTFTPEGLDSLSDFRQPGSQIFIFDTAQSLAKFPAPIQEIFTADPPLEIKPSPGLEADFAALPPYWEDDQPNNDHYDMSDHGTFIASIIRSITPSTKIYLYEVLNRYGDGSFLTIAHGLAEALNQLGQDNKHKIFNCSFGIVHKLPENKSAPQNLKDLLSTLSRPPFDELIFKAVRDAFAPIISHPHITVVASAGNDAENDTGGRPPAWYPAGFEKVLSVAALPKDQLRDENNKKLKPAKYSNLAHSPGKDKAYSFATIGGERKAYSVGTINGKRQYDDPAPFSPVGGILGVYIGKIPIWNAADQSITEGPDNVTGYAEWSGTSFAAPIISALLARPESERVPENQAVPNKEVTVDDENAILVSQG
jgi:hypothetical protein